MDEKPIKAMINISLKDASNDVIMEVPEQILYLFVTKTCPNCRQAKEYLKGIQYMVIDADENPELVSKYDVMQAPTLVRARDMNYKKYVNAANIKKYAESTRQLT